jgi:spermidine synthase
MAITFLLCLVFFLSGAAALLFETLWFRGAGLALGNSIWASSLVLAGFMGGLALGNAWASRRGYRVRRPVRLYAGLELAIGATGLALVHGLLALPPVLAPHLGPLLDTPWLLNALRLGAGFALLLIPSTAMGMTLPLLAAALHRRDPQFGRVLGRLYGWNTLGAVAGALAGDAFLVAWLGVRGSGLAAAVANLCAAGVAFALSRVLDAEPAARGPEVRARPLPARARFLLAAAFVAGGTLLALEVLWFRLLSLFVHASSLAFSLMLAVVLAGIGAGSLAASRWLAHRPEAWRALPAVALASGFLLLATYTGLVLVLPAVGGGEASRPWLQTLQLALFLMLPVALLSGVLFTLLGTALIRECPGATRAAGLLTLCNTTGAALGSLLAGFWLLPTFGVERSIEILAVSYAAAAGLAIAGGASPARERRATAIYATGVLLLAALALFPRGLAERAYLTAPIRWYTEVDHAIPVETREGLTETLSYLRTDRFGEPAYYRLVTNAHSMSATMVIAQRYMKLFVYLPAAIHPELRRALLVCYGVGGTAQALTYTQSLEHIDVVDTSRDVLEMSRHAFPDRATHPLSDPRVEVHVEDGRFFLQTTSERYDLITGEPPPPKNAGIVNLYTREHFALIRDRLEEGGIASYWLPVHSLLPRDSEAIVRAFCGVFEDCTLWDASSLNWILLGSRGATGPVTEEHFARQWADPRVGRDLRIIGFERPEQLGAIFLGDAESLLARTAAALPLDDDHPGRLSETFARTAEMPAAYRDWLDIDRARERFAESPLVARLWPSALREATLPWFEWQRVLTRSLLGQLGAPAEELPELHRILTRSELRTLPLWYLGTDADDERAADAALAKGKRGPALEYHQGARALAARDWESAARHFEGARALGAGNRELLYYRVYALAMAGRRDEALRFARETGIPDPGESGDAAFARFATRELGIALDGLERTPGQSAAPTGPKNR